MIERSKQRLVLVGTVMDAGGYAYNNRNVIKRLNDLGWDCKLEAINGTIEVSPEELNYLNSLRMFKKNIPQVYMDKNCIKIFSHIPVKNVPKFKRNIIYTMSETRLPHPRFVHACNTYYDELWTPTEWNAQGLIERGLKIPTKVVPIGIDEIYNEENAGIELPLSYAKFGNGPEQPEGFKFLSVFRWSYRKGFDLLVKSFLRRFKQQDGVCLVIHSRHAAMSHAKQFSDYVANDLDMLYNLHKKEDSPPIYLCQDIVPMWAMPSFYRKHDAFVSTSRGEGFSIPTLEAAKMGLPVIVPNHTGFTSYANSETAFVFDVDSWVVCDTIPEWHRGSWITPMFTGQEFPFFGEETVESVAELMKFVKENPEECITRNKRLKEKINKDFEWGKIITDIDKRLLEL